jgi:GNAT superfamily N-acetyltransferase
MSDYEILPADWRATWWAVGRDLRFLREVDPSFAPGRLSLLNRLLLRTIVLPMAYSRSTGRYLIIWDGQRAGFLYTRQRGASLSLETFGVEVAYRRQGLGRALIEKAIDHAMQQSLSFVTASVTPENGPAQALLGSLSFRPYRSYRFELAGKSFEAPGQGRWTLRELSALEAQPGYDKWQQATIKAGDPWAAELLLDVYLRSGWKGNARHWACLIGNEESGYLRLAGLGGKYQAYIACKPSAWKLGAPIHWLKQAIEAYPSDLQYVTVDLASDAQFAASREIWTAAGFQMLPRERYLMILPLPKANRDKR